MLLRPFYILDTFRHTMGSYLLHYLAMKIHPLLDEFTGDRIVVRGNYNRETSIISYKEKKGKIFNWKRPTVQFSEDGATLYVNCFPSHDYVMHYGALVKTYFALQQVNKDVVVQVPQDEEAYAAFIESNITLLPKVECVIFGKVEQLHFFNHTIHWEGEGDFQWSIFQYHGKKIALLGCAFSVWGDSAGRLVACLAHQGIKAFIYTGKLGALNSSIIPNAMLATGGSTHINGHRFAWDSIIKIPHYMQNVICGDHITVFSPLAETTDWCNRVKHTFDFVDPEIGHMAVQAQQHGVDFGYIHIVSDNVVKMSEENLSNERKQDIVQKRALLTDQILQIIAYTLEHYRA